MAASMATRNHGARHRQHVAPLFERGPRRDQGTASFGGLNHYNRQRQATNHPIPKREVPRQWRSGRRQFRDEAAGFPDLLEQPSVLTRIHNIDAAPEYSDGWTAPLEGPFVGGGVDSPRQSAHDRQPRLGEIPAQSTGLGDAAGTGVPGSDDGHGGTLQHVSPARRPEDDGRVDDFG
jgi:hypothetical protein